MSSSHAQSALKEYGKVNVQSGVSYANPHRLILMLLDGALEKISSAKGFMQRKEIAEKGNYISWAISIIEGLQTSLDFDKGGELAINLSRLYDFMIRNLIEANAQNSTKKLDEVSELLSQIKSAWNEIPITEHGDNLVDESNVNISPPFSADNTEP